MTATATQRTANEAAASAAFINHEYLEATVLTVPRIDAEPTRAVAKPLTLVMTIKSSQDRAELARLLNQMQALQTDQNPITRALRKLGNVHFARFVFLGDEKLAVITTYDGKFDAYIDAFVNELGDVFDQLLKHMQDAPPLPVAQNRPQFLDFVKRNDIAPAVLFYSAYPQLGVQDILLLEGKH